MNGLDLTEFKKYVILPTLAALPERWNSPAAINLLAGTMLVESSGVYIEQIPNGPAVGVYQMEPATHDDCYNTFLNYVSNVVLKRAVQSLLAAIPNNPIDQMHGNLYYATAMARVKYIRSPEMLPDYDDALGLAAYHKNFYNTAGGATVISASKLLFQQAISA